MVLSRIQWKLISSEKADGFVSVQEYECPVPYSRRKYHLCVIVTPESEHRSYSII